MKFSFVRTDNGKLPLITKEVEKTTGRMSIL